MAVKSLLAGRTRRRVAVFAAIVLVALVTVVIVRARRLGQSEIATSGPVIAFQIGREEDGEAVENLHGFWRAVKRVSVGEPIRAEALAALHDAGNFRRGSSRGFDPGLALRVGSGGDAVDAMICLKCNIVYFFRVNDSMAYKHLMLTPDGHAVFLRIYKELFGEPARDAEVGR